MIVLMRVEPDKKLDLPLGRLSGVFAACLTTFVGISVGHNPDLIAVRVILIIPVAAFVGFIIGRVMNSLATRTPKTSKK